MKRDRWYPISALPPGRVHVRVVWEARVFEAVRAINPATKKLGWCEYRQGKIQWLPPTPKRKDLAWTPEPDRWQPLDPDAWGLPLPEPLPVQVTPRMYSTRTRFAAVEEAEASELAREMERDREDAKSRREIEAEVEEADLRWWRDITNIRYEPAGEVTPRMAEGRLLRAVAVCGAGQELTLPVHTPATVMSRLAQAAEAAQHDDTRWHGRLEFRPLPQDHDDFTTAMGWFTALNPPEASRRKAWALNRAQLIILRRTLSIPRTWTDIASFHRISRTRVQEIYAAAIAAVTRVANGLPAFEGRARVDHMAALRERNRSYRRSQQ